MKKIIVSIIVSLTLLCQSCSKQNPIDIGGEPNPPRWVELSVNIDSLPVVGKTGSIQFQFLVTGKGDKMPVAYETGDTVNYIRISFRPDNGIQGSTIMSGDTLWEGKVNFLDTIKLNTHFTLLQTPYDYFTLEGGYREFNWAVDILIGYYYKDVKGNLIGYFGNSDPYVPFNNPTYAYLYINTKTGDTYLKIKALKSNKK